MFDFELPVKVNAMGWGVQVFTPLDEWMIDNGFWMQTKKGVPMRGIIENHGTKLLHEGRYGGSWGAPVIV